MFVAGLLDQRCNLRRQIDRLVRILPGDAGFRARADGIKVFLEFIPKLDSL